MTSPIIAFGTVVAVAGPDGVPMREFLEVVERVRSQGRLPDHFREYFQASHLDIMDQRMVELRIVPTVAVAPGLSAAIACTEILMVLGEGVFPGWRPPVCLPELFLVDLVSMSYRVAHLNDVKE